MKRVKLLHLRQDKLVLIKENVSSMFATRQGSNQSAQIQGLAK